VKSDQELDDGIESAETTEQHDVGAPPNVSGLNRLTWKSKNLTDMRLGTCNAMETRMNKRNKKRLD